MRAVVVALLCALLGACVPAAVATQTLRGGSTGEIKQSADEVPFLAVTAPYSGEQVEAGTTAAITWASTGNIAHIAIFLCWDGDCGHVLAPAVDADVSRYLWSVSRTQVPGDDYHIKIRANAFPNVTATGPAFSVLEEGDDKLGPFLLGGFGFVVVASVALIYYANRKQRKKYAARRSRLELAHTQQRERLLNEYNRRVGLLLPRCLDPFVGGTAQCQDSKWEFKNLGREGRGQLKCLEGERAGMSFQWQGSATSGCMELRILHPFEEVGYCDWDGDVLRWHSPYRVRVRGNGYVWKYETSLDLTHFMLHGVRRGVSFVDEPSVEEGVPRAVFPRQWALSEDKTSFETKRMKRKYPGATVHGSFPPMLLLVACMMPATLAELQVQHDLYNEQQERERQLTEERRKARAMRLFGRMALVSRFPDVKIQVVDSGEADIHVQLVQNEPPTGPGMWQLVSPNASPSYRVQVVRRNADFTVKYVKSFPCVNL